MRYRAAELYDRLLAEGCSFEGDAYLTGSAWLDPNCQVFFLPFPDEVEGVHWFDAEMVDENLMHRWIAHLIAGLKRYD